MANGKKRKYDFDGWAVIYTEELGGEIIPAYVHWRKNCHNAELFGRLAIKKEGSWLLVGYFDKEYIAQNALKYTKTKFFRAMFQFQKLCQFNPLDSPEALRGNVRIGRNEEMLNWFDVGFAIDWNKSISEIDRQLYKIFELPQHCIDFIEQRIDDTL